MTDTIVDRVFFKELAKRDPEEVCKLTFCRYDSKDKCYLVNIWNDEFAVYPYESKIHHVGETYHHKYVNILIVHYLLCSSSFNVSNEWVSEKDLPGGASFFRGPHEIPTHCIRDRFNNSIDEFRKRSEQLGGISLDLADSAYVFTIAPRIPVAVLYWQGDEHFGSESKLLFDKSLGEHMALDVIYALSVVVCTQVANKPIN